MSGYKIEMSTPGKEEGCEAVMGGEKEGVQDWDLEVAISEDLEEF